MILRQMQETRQKSTVANEVKYRLLRLPADSPVLIQSGFAILAIAKISAARNRQPEMIVSLSMSPGDNAVIDESGGGRPLSKRDPGSWEPQAGLLSVQPRPLQQEPAVVVPLCILQRR